MFTLVSPNTDLWVAIWAQLLAQVGILDGWSYEGSASQEEITLHYFKHTRCSFDRETGYCEHGVHYDDRSEIVELS